MTVEDLRALISEVVEEKLSELISSEDDFEINSELRPDSLINDFRLKMANAACPLTK